MSHANSMASVLVLPAAAAAAASAMTVVRNTVSLVDLSVICKIHQQEQMMT